MKFHWLLLMLCILAVIPFAMADTISGNYNTGLVSYYTFENNLIDSLGVNNGTNGGTFELTSGFSGKGRIQNTSNTAFLLPHAVLNKTTFTINVWVKTVGTTGLSDVMASWSQSILLGYSDANMQGYINTGGNVGATVAHGITRTNWNMMTMVYNSTHVMTYINGVVKINATGTGTTQTPTCNSSKYTLMNYYNDPTCNSFAGLGLSIDELGFWGKALTTADIVAIYNSGSGTNYTDPDTTPPTISAPSNASSAYLAFNGVTFNATDDTSVNTATWRVNNTNFNITTAGFLNKTVNLGVGSYVLNVSVNDTSGNMGSVLWNLTVTQASSTAYAYINNSRANLSIMANSNNWTNAITMNCSTYGDANSTSTNSTNYTLGTQAVTCTYPNSQNYSSSTETWNLTVTAYVDSVLPVITAPANMTANGTWAGAQFNATDNVYIKLNGWTVNSTNFTINGSGYLSANVSSWHNMTWVLNITVNDTSDNIGSKLFSLNFTEFDTSPPIIYYQPNATIEFSDSWAGVNFSATDNWGLANWSVNNSGFIINSTGWMNSSYTAIGNYTVNVTMNDTSGNNGSVLYNLQIVPYIDDVDPVFVIFPADMSIEYGTLFTGVNVTTSDNIGIKSVLLNDSNFVKTYLYDNRTLTRITRSGVMTVGTYYVNVTVNDSSDNMISRVWNLNVTADDTLPVLSAPMDTVIEYGEGWNGVNITCTDIFKSTMWINETNFTINNSGYLRNTSIVNISNYYINVSCNDTSGNIGSLVYNVNVTADVTPPVITSENLTWETDFPGYYIEGYDNVGIVNWSVNNTAQFSINSSGWIQLLYNPSYGNYSTYIYAFDNAGNNASLDWNLEYLEREGMQLWSCPASDGWNFVYLIFAVAAAFIVLAFAIGEGIFGLLGGLVVTFSYMFIGACAPLLTIVIPIGGIMIMAYFILYYGKERL
jgi:hypothetical protein